MSVLTQYLYSIAFFIDACSSFFNQFNIPTVLSEESDKDLDGKLVHIILLHFLKSLNLSRINFQFSLSVIVFTKSTYKTG